MTKHKITSTKLYFATKPPKIIEFEATTDNLDKIRKALKVRHNCSVVTLKSQIIKKIL